MPLRYSRSLALTVLTVSAVTWNGCTTASWKPSWLSGSWLGGQSSAAAASSSTAFPGSATSGPTGIASLSGSKPFATNSSAPASGMAGFQAGTPVDSGRIDSGIANSFRKAGDSVKSAFHAAAENLSTPANTQAVSSDPVKMSTPVPKLSANLYLQAAALLEAKGDAEGALRKHEDALQIHPNDIAVMLSAANLCQRHGRHDMAIEYYHRAIRQDARHPAAHNELGLCLARQGQLQEAASEISTAIQLQPDNPAFHNNLAILCVEQGDKAGALQQLTLASGPANAHYNLGQMLFQRGEYAEARDLFERALSLDPQLAPAQDMLARLQIVANPAPDGSAPQDR